MAATGMELDTASATTDSEKEARPRPRLEELPEELLSNISYRLDHDDISSLRLSCRAVEAKSFHNFAIEYFSVKGFLLSSDSLKALKGISQDKRLRRYIHNIFISTAYFTEKAFDCPNGCHCAWQPTVRQAEAYKTYLKDQKRLKEDGEDLRVLTKAFKRLPELTSLHLRDSTRYEEDLPDASPYGVRKINRRCARSPSYSSSKAEKKDVEYTRWCTHVWKTMCKAVSESGLDTLTSFGVYINTRSDGLSVSQDFRLGTKTLANLRKGLKNLKSARLTIRSNSLIKRNGSTDSEASVTAIEKFANTFRQPSLEDLTLSYDNMPTSHPIHVALATNLELSNLRKLSIDGLVITAGALITTLTRLGSIKDLQISWTNLIKGTWVPVLQAMQKMGKLGHLHLMWLQEAGSKVYFLTQPDLDAEDDWYDDHGAGFNSEDDDDDTSSDSLPELEPMPGTEETAGPPPTPAEHVTAAALHDFTAPGYDDSPERGYYVCIKGYNEISKYLGIFIKEYNLGENLDDADHLPFPHMAGPVPPAINNLMNNLFGGPLPAVAGGAGGYGGGAGAHGHGAGHIHGPPPAPGGTGAHGGGAAAHGHGAHGGGGPIHGPPPPPGFMTVGGGPGFSMMMGSVPLHHHHHHHHAHTAAPAGGAAHGGPQHPQPHAPANLNPTVQDEADEDAMGGAPVPPGGYLNAEELLNAVFDSEDDGGW